MKLSLNWLNEFVDLADVHPNELVDLLTMKTCEVEGFTNFMQHLAEIPVAHIDALEKHPDADKLKICKVNTGKEVIQIVTGASNVEQGKKFPVAQVGVTLPDGPHKDGIHAGAGHKASMPNGRTMAKAKLRGVESFGMLCSGSELGITQLNYAPAKIDGLMPLPDDWEVGTPLSHYLGGHDIIFDIDNKSITHRPDLWSHFGFAREIAALLDKPLKKNPEKTTAQSIGIVPKKIPLPKIQIQGDAAITYNAAEISQFKVAPSPLLRQMRLLSIGQKPINNIVDISNYVLFEMGQPNHAFDRAKIQGPVQVSLARANEKIDLLDGTTHTLPIRLIVIRDHDKPVALAGVMGGAGTETSNNTTSIFLESATFHRSHIRMAVSKTGIRSDSSQRFEKAQDPSKALPAIYRFAEILNEEQPGIELSEVASVSAIEFDTPVTMKVSNAFINQKLGKIQSRSLSNAEVLTRLGFIIEEQNEVLTVTVPSYRKWFDITRPEDLVEEIGRFIGYKEITIEAPLVACETPRTQNFSRALEHRLRALAAERFHLNEVMSYAFHSEKDLNADESFTTAAQAMKMKNAINDELNFMRISPLPGLLRAVQTNYREEENVRLFEIEKIFLPSSDERLARNETYFFAAALTSTKSAADALTDLSAMAGEILTHAGLLRHEQVFSNTPSAIFHPGRSGTAGAHDKKIIRFGQVHPRLLAEYGIKEDMYYLDTKLDDLLSLTKNISHYRAPFTHPGVEFDLTLVIPRHGTFAELKKAAGFVDPLVRRDLDKTVMVCFDYVGTFEGGNLADGEKAVSVRVEWRNPTRTLAGDEIKKLQDGLIHKMQKVGFKLR
ncbi:MAG TPA: phenylalanine--tRNA ligase subunit beta [Turneriella sp.]|nr:phenylalanine--tRNA ligase subunit beta [Turneriella sp.]